MTNLGPLDRDTCQQLLGPHLPTLDACFRTAWSRWQKWLANCEGPPTDVSPRTRASALYDFIAAEAANSFYKDPKILVRKERSFLVLRFSNKIALRFKKFRGTTLKSSANKTRQSSLFESQQLELSTPDSQPMTHVIAGYLLDDLALDIDRVAITCTIDGQHVWAPIDLVGDSDVRAASTTDPTAAKPRVRSTRKKPRKPTSGEE